MIPRIGPAGASPPLGLVRLAARVALVGLLLAPLAATGCGRKQLPPTVGAPEDIMKNSEGKVGPMPGTPGYKPPKPAK